MPIKNEKGFTLLEVMVAVFVLATGLLGMATLQLSAIKANQSAEHKTRAVFLASDILDRMRANQKAIQADNSDYEISLGDESPTCDRNATPADYDKRPTLVAKCDLHEWRASIEAYLPEGRSAVECPKYDHLKEFAHCIITIEWIDFLPKLGSQSVYNSEVLVLKFQGAIGGQGVL